MTQLPTGPKVPKGISVEELDIYIDSLIQALNEFDAGSTSVLEGAANMQDARDDSPDIMPREEVFLISSFLLNLRQAASQIMEMLKHSRKLIEKHQRRRGRRSVHTPRINWHKWLYTGGDEDERMPASGRQDARRGTSDDHDDDNDDEEEEDATNAGNSEDGPLNDPSDRDLEGGTLTRVVAHSSAQPLQRSDPKKAKPAKPAAGETKRVAQLRESLADLLEWMQSSEDLLYAFKLTLAVFLVSFPAFHPAWTDWYYLNRGRK